MASHSRHCSLRWKRQYNNRIAIRLQSISVLSRAIRCYPLHHLRRRELVTTDTELSAIAAAAKTGLSTIPKKG